MANRLQLKRGTGAPGSIFYEGEPVLDLNDSALYVGNSGGTGTGAGTSIANAETFLASLQILNRATTANAGAIDLYEDADNGTSKVRLIAPASLSGDLTLTLPSVDGSTSQVLATDGSGNLSFIDAVASLTVGADSGTDDSVSLLADTLTFTGGEGIDTAVTDNTITISGEDATDANKGIASFSDTTDFSVSSGDVSLADTVVKTVTTDSGALTPSSHGFSVLGGEGMDVTHTGTTITVAGEDATDANKGIASFDSGDFGVTSGAVTLVDTVVKTVTTDSGALTPSSHGLSILGGEGMDVTHTGTTVTVAGEDASSSNKGIASFDSGDFTVSSGNVVLADSATGAVTTINGTTNEVEVSRSNGTVTVGLPDDVTIAGQLTVSGDLRVVGTAVTFETETVKVEDRLLELGLVAGAAPSSSTTWDTGIAFNYYATSAKKSALIWLNNSFMVAASEISESADTGTADPQISISAYAPLVSNGLYIGGITAGDEVINSSKEAVNLVFDGGTYS
jgi:hypothetical protein